MSGEVIAATAAGVATAGAALVLDQNLAMASAGGAAMFLAVSVTTSLQSRFFFVIGSYILGYIAGLACMNPSSELPQWAAAVVAFTVSATGSGIFASLHGWLNGGPEPKWFRVVSKFWPFRFKKGGSE